MLAVPAKAPPRGPGWAFEYKWDGVRVILRHVRGELSLRSRLGNDITDRYPETHDVPRSLAQRDAVLDGEIIALDERSRPSFGLLQERMHVRNAEAVRRLMRRIPVVYMAFDLLWLDGGSLMGLPYDRRRQHLEELGLAGTHWQTPAYHCGRGAALLGAARRMGLEGIIAKQIDSLYEPGRRSGAWRKIKAVQGQELVVGGWTANRSGRKEEIGSLLVGYYDGDELRYAGKVGTGFTAATHRQLHRLLVKHEQEHSPFADPPRLAARYVKPALVAEVEFTEWTRQGSLRHPAFKGLRTDKKPRDVVREDPG
jgi:bifunctional non-homologous end joining protein LigD